MTPNVIEDATSAVNLGGLSGTIILMAMALVRRVDGTHEATDRYLRLRQSLISRTTLAAVGFGQGLLTLRIIFLDLIPSP
jgi:hypothetical protein